MRRTRPLLALLVPVAFVASLLTPSAALAAPAEPVEPAESAAPASPEPAGTPGAWEVFPAPGGYGVRWTSPAALPVTSDRPRVLWRGRPLETTRDGRRLDAFAPGVRRPQAFELDAVLSGRALDEGGRPVAGGPLGTRGAAAGSASGTAASGSAVAAPTSVYPVDPAKPGTYATAASDYDAETLKYPGFPQSLNVRGHVVQPRAGQVSGRRPVVLFLHGRHDYCYPVKGAAESAPAGAWRCPAGTKRVPSELGYQYLQQLLASQGYVTVSIDAAAINAMDDASPDGGAEARGLLVKRHLDLWKTWADQGRYPADLGNVVLVGHSRGGEGVNRAAQLVREDAPYRIAGVVYLAPTNFAGQTIPYVPAVTVLPSCDGDVSDLQGQSYVDLDRDIAPDDTSLKASTLVIGANHNYFNTEWTPGLSKAPSFDDAGAMPGCKPGAGVRLSAGQQQASGKAYVAGAVWWMTGQGDARARLLFDGTPGRVASVGARPVFSHAIMGGRDLRRVGVDAKPTAAVGAKASLCRAVMDYGPGSCAADGAFSPHWKTDWASGEPFQQELFVRWTAAGQRAGVAFAKPLSLRDRASLDLRLIANPADGGPAISLRVTDAHGAVATVDPAGGRSLPLFGAKADAQPGARVAQTVRVPTASLAGIDAGAIASVEIVGRSASGSVWLLDVASVPTATPAAPSVRMPTIALGDARVVEGNGPGQGRVDLPFTVSGTLGREATFVVRPACDGVGTCPSVFSVTVPAGAKNGVVRLPYERNTTWDGAQRLITASARPVRGVMPTRDTGVARIIEDDPRPVFTVKPLAARIKEGARASWRVSLSAPAGVPLYVRAVFVKPAKGRAVQVRDLDRTWVRQYYGRRPAAAPFAGEWTALYGTIEPGKREVTFSVPTVKDRVKDAGEQIVLTVDYEPGFPRDTCRYPVVVG